MTKENDELRRMRNEIEKKVARRTSEIQQSIFDKKLKGVQQVVETPVEQEEQEEQEPAPTPVKAKKVSPATTPERESAVARIKREREERRRSAMPEEDVEMMSAAGSEDEDGDINLQIGSSSPTRLSEVSNFTPSKTNCKTVKDCMRFKLHATEVRTFDTSRSAPTDFLDSRSCRHLQAFRQARIHQGLRVHLDRPKPSPDHLRLHGLCPSRDRSSPSPAAL